MCDIRKNISGQPFIWNIEKYNKNITEHHVTFEEAATVFLSDAVEIFPDEEHSYDEARFRAAGLSDKLRLLLVCHCERDEGDAIRIISAWKIKPEQLRRLREEYYL
ncbi:MAG: BrnT family toxin [Defluviitaleaceae bacterium]|nr:BrnT family toxin [Defluviitaleaceae bacterium]MCL2274177.1 BrnT family toxin [Defluviitaleaceae bacterium]